jgi:hypothetical protein
VHHTSGVHARAVLSMSRVRDTAGGILYLAVFHHRPGEQASWGAAMKQLRIVT